MIVALIVAALIVLVVNAPGTVKLPINPFTALKDAALTAPDVDRPADSIPPVTDRCVKVPTFVMLG